MYLIFMIKNHICHIVTYIHDTKMICNFVYYNHDTTMKWNFVSYIRYTTIICDIVSYIHDSPMICNIVSYVYDKNMQYWILYPGYTHIVSYSNDTTIVYNKTWSLRSNSCLSKTFTLCSLENLKFRSFDLSPKDHFNWS